MSAGAKFGICLGVSFVVLDAIGSPLLWAAFWTAEVIQGAIAARLTWRRTGLMWSTLGMTDAMITGAVLVPVHLAGYTLRTLPFPWLVAFIANAALLLFIYFLGTREDPDKWRRWTMYMNDLSVMDVLRFRHIPELR